MASSTNTDTTTLTAHCLCKANIFKTQVPTSNLPLPAYICHCNSCRHLTGALYTADTRWPEPRSTIDVSSLKSYSFSPRIDLLFCPTCSTPLFFRNPQNETRPLGVFTGALTNDIVDPPVNFVNQSFVADTLDGGASIWLHHPNPNGEETKRYMLDSEADDAEEVPRDWPSSSEVTKATKEDAIPIRCKCTGTSFLLHRGDYSNIKESDLPWSIDPQTHNLLAGFCGCNSCRLQSGLDVFNWTFAEMKYISFGQNISDKQFPTSGKELKALVDDHDPAIGTLRYYKSSENVERYFCSTCSACIFYAVSDRPHMLDIAIGVLRAVDGAKAEGTLSWPYGGRISFREDGDGGWRQGLFDRVERDAEEFRVRRGLPKNWARRKAERKDEEGRIERM